MKSGRASCRFLITVVLLVLMISSSSCMVQAASGNKDIAADKKECQSSLLTLATCLPYVQTQAKTPTADCCEGLGELLKANRKCLCVLIKDSSDPNLGISFNITRAAQLPIVCGKHYNITECPSLLNLSPDSKDAQVFKQFEGTSSSPSYEPTSGTSSSGKTPAVNSATGTASSTSTSYGTRIAQNYGHHLLMSLLFISIFFFFSEFS